ncbi:MAG TPA: hypothetical protein VL523_15265 [Terriglobia bacterium]|nr:hypothetical protein [Terriglobia bacterium]
MRYSVVVRYRDEGHFPGKRTLDERVYLKDGEPVLIPDVGDHVTYQYEGRPTAFKVLSRDFAYSDDSCKVSLEVGGPPGGQGPLSLKE